MCTNRVRIRFAKVGKVRFTSHRDLARIWERAMRKANVRVAYSEGFSPRPKLHFGLALSTGHESQAEYLDVDLVDEVRLDELATRLDPVLTPGVTVTGADFVASGTPSLQEDVVACRWAFTLDGVDHGRARDAVAHALAADTITVTRTRKGEERTDDVRSAIEALTIVDDTTPVVLDAILATKPRGLRPSELLAAVFPNDPEPEHLARRVVRLQQFIERDGSRCELPPLTQAPAPHALVVCA